MLATGANPDFQPGTHTVLQDGSGLLFHVQLDARKHSEWSVVSTTGLRGRAIPSTMPVDRPYVAALHRPRGGGREPGISISARRQNDPHIFQDTAIVPGAWRQL